MSTSLNTDYPKELANLTLSRLVDEPRRIRTSISSIQTSKRKCVMGNYEAFITSADCVGGLIKECSSMQTHAQSLSSEITSIKGSLAELTAATETYSNKCQELRLVRQHFHTISGILEVPGLMQKCVWFGHYDDALQLLSFIGQLKESQPDAPLITNVFDQVQACVPLLGERITRDLTGDGDFHTFFRLISQLRRVGWISPELLPRHFLMCRNHRLLNRLVRTKVASAKQHLSKFVEVFRVEMLDAIKIHRAIFDVTPEQRWHAEVELSAWATLRMFDLHTQLKSRLHEIDDGGMMRSLLDSCVHTSTSLAQFGLQFTETLVPLFATVIQNQFQTKITETVKILMSQIEEQKWSEVSSQASRRSAATQPTANTTNTIPNPLSFTTPAVLMDARPLAVFTNSILTLLNDVRQCALVVLAVPFTNSFFHEIQPVIPTIEQLCRSYAHLSVSPNLDIEGLHHFCKLWGETCVPFLGNCISQVFGRITDDMCTNAISTIGAQAKRIFAPATPKLVFKDPPTKIRESSVEIPVDSPADVSNVINELNEQQKPTANGDISIDTVPHDEDVPKGEIINQSIEHKNIE